jgi:hypothetical protein
MSVGFRGNSIEKTVVTPDAIVCTIHHIKILAILVADIPPYRSFGDTIPVPTMAKVHF